MPNASRRIEVTEGQNFRHPSIHGDDLRKTIEGLEDVLRPRIRFLSENRAGLRLQNVIGNIQLNNGTILQIQPKVAGGEDWTSAVISLLTGEERIAVAGERRSGTSSVHRNLLDALADVYLTRLERAIRLDGPLLLMERENLVLPHLRGTLNASEWLKKAAWMPHRFPVSVTRLASDNPFTKGLSEVAKILAAASSSARIKAGLNAVRRDLSANTSPSNFSTQAATSRKLPAQWNAYKPAWSIAVAVLNRSSLFGTTGNHVGLSLAIEPWPLLEKALEKTLFAIESRGARSGRRIETQMKGRLPLLDAGRSTHQGFSVEPDGRMFEDANVVATFEAKYKPFDGIPARNDIYQAVTTASVCGAALAILVYPTSFASRIWNVNSFNGKPAKLAAIGMDMFSWAGNETANERANYLLNFIDGIRSGNAVHVGTVA